MKTLLGLIAALALTACSNTPPPPPEPEGDEANVNPPIVFLIDLYTDENKAVKATKQSKDK